MVYNKEKYLKYKIKYNKLINQIGGMMQQESTNTTTTITETVHTQPNLNLEAETYLEKLVNEYKYGTPVITLKLTNPKSLKTEDYKKLEKEIDEIFNVEQTEEAESSDPIKLLKKLRNRLEYYIWNKLYKNKKTDIDKFIQNGFKISEKLTIETYLKKQIIIVNLKKKIIQLKEEYAELIDKIPEENNENWQDEQGNSWYDKIFVEALKNINRFENELNYQAKDIERTTKTEITVADIFDKAKDVLDNQRTKILKLYNLGELNKELEKLRRPVTKIKRLADRKNELMNIKNSLNIINNFKEALTPEQIVLIGKEETDKLSVETKDLLDDLEEFQKELGEAIIEKGLEEEVIKEYNKIQKVFKLSEPTEIVVGDLIESTNPNIPVDTTPTIKEETLAEQQTSSVDEESRFVKLKREEYEELDTKITKLENELSEKEDEEQRIREAVNLNISELEEDLEDKKEKIKELELNDNKLAEALKQQEISIKEKEDIIKDKLLSDERIVQLEKQLEDLSGTSLIDDDEFINTDRVVYTPDITDPTVEPISESIKRIENWIPKVSRHKHIHKDSSPEKYKIEDAHAHHHTHNIAPYEDVGRHLRLEPHGHSGRSEEHMELWHNNKIQNITNSDVVNKTDIINPNNNTTNLNNNQMQQNKLDENNKHRHKHQHKNKTGKGSIGHNHKHKHRDSNIGNHTEENSSDYPHYHKKPDSRHDN